MMDTRIHKPTSHKDMFAAGWQVQIIVADVATSVSTASSAVCARSRREN